MNPLYFGMGGFALFRMECRYVPLLTFFLLLNLPLLAQNPLAPAGKFNVFTQGNATLISNESEGAVAIGGNLTVGGNYQVAFISSGDFTQPAFPTVKIGLVVGGGVKLQNGTLRVLNNGFIKIGNCAGGGDLNALKVWFRDQNNATSPIKITKSTDGYANPSSFIELNGNVNTFYSSLADTASNPICQPNVIDFATAFTTLKANSQTLTNCVGNVRTTNANGDVVTNFSGQNLYLRDPLDGLPANTTRVLNITGADLNAVNNITFSFTPTASQPLVINVSTGATFSWNVTNQNVNGSMRYIIWNFPNATTLNIEGNATIEGSVLAPYATITKTVNNSNVQGQLIGQTLLVDDGEMHNYPFEGNVTCGTPVCNAPTPFADGITRCGPGTVTFAASGCTNGFTAKWFDAANLSNQVGSGNSFTTPSLSSTTNYFLSCVKNDDATCKSLPLTVTATVNPAVTVSISGPETVCGTELPVTYTGSPAGGSFNLPGGIPEGAITVNANGLTINPATSLASLTFSYAVTGTNGCGGSASKSVTINNGGTKINLSPAILCENQSSTYTDPEGTTGTWSGFGVTDTGTGATISAAQALIQSGTTAPATVYIYYTQTNGACTRKDSGLVTINPRPVVTIAGPETVCASELPVNFTASPVGGTFNLPNGLPQGAVTINGHVVTINAGSTLTSLTFGYSYTDPQTGCSANTTKTISISPAPKPTVNSPTICEGETTTLTAAACAGSLLWSNSATSASINVSPITTTTYTVTCTIGDCEGTATATVTVNPKPEISISGDPVCSSDLTTFTVNFAATTNAIITADKGTISGNSVTGVPAGETVKIIATLNGCSDTLTITKDCDCPTITPPTLAAAPTAICVGESTTLSASGCTGTVTFFADQALNQPLASLTVSPTATKIYYATCTDQASDCVSQPAEITVTVNEKPEISISGDPVCSSDLTTFTVNFNATTNAIITADKGTITGNSVTGVPAGETVKIVATLNGCSDTLTITKDCDCPTTTPPTLAATPTAICVGESTTLSASGCTGTVTFFADQALNQPLASLTVSPTATKTYYATCTDQASDCVSQPAEITVTVNEKPEISISATTCSTDGLTFDIAFTATPNATVTANKGTLSGNTVIGIASGDTVKLIVSLNGCIDSTTATQNCLVPTGSLGDFVWKDLNDNGQQDDDEPGVEAIKIILWSAVNNLPAQKLDSTQTSTAGAYGFTNLPKGDYIVQIDLTTLPDSCEISDKKNIGNDATDSDFSTDGLSDVVSLDPALGGLNKDNPTIDAALLSPCIRPELGSITISAATCTNLNTNNDASFALSGLQNAARYTYATSPGELSNYAAATNLTGTNLAISGLPNPGAPAGQTYYIRLFASEDCFTDTLIQIPFRDCNIDCVKPEAGNDVFLCSPTSEVNLPDATPEQQWIAGAGNPGGSIDISSGLVTGLTNDGIYTYILLDAGLGSTCSDTVFVLKGSITLSNLATCEDTLTLPLFVNGTWAAAAGNTATVTPAGQISGMSIPGMYTFVLTNGDCQATLLVERQACDTPCPVFSLVGNASDTLCSGYYGEALSAKIGTNLPVKLVRFTSPQTSATVYSGGELIETLTPIDSLVSWPIGLPGSQFPANSGTTPVTYYMYLIADDTTALPTGCRPFAEKRYTVLPLPKFTMSTEPVCVDSTTYTVTLTIQTSGTFNVVLANGLSSIGNGPIPQGILQEANDITGNGGTVSFTLPLADSSAVILVTNVATGCASADALINPTIVTCDKRYDLALDKSIDKKLAMIGETINYTIRVWNEGEGNATGVEVTDLLNAGVQYMTHATAQGNYTAATGIWQVGNLAVGDTAILSIAVKVVAEGVWFNTAEISKMNEKDIDSTPDNGNESEDDIDRECFTVPILLCRGQSSTIELAVPMQYSNVVWFRKVQGGQPVQVAIGNTLSATETEPGSYEYTFTSSAGSCPAEGCCPIILAVQDCCPVEICVPFTLKRVKL
ncbi:collagen-binding domain-containing protein [Arundinibacter roseus]|uniref:Choice-of-anchor A family protein n=1 Tax=Arundinibacter roseus TaxID=2070510 RepID=A0A4R4K1I4_9BACT|nr:collagen-binding domain-containing protein [Arundinibacter roseus]TDB61164.1 choice-of-anchor A family protein [Arundinibacter roseus]